MEAGARFVDLTFLLPFSDSSDIRTLFGSSRFGSRVQDALR